MKAPSVCALDGQTPPIPPLSQSRQADMACQCLYIRKHVVGGRMAESQAATTGIEVHQVLATYINQLVQKRRSTDLELLDRLISGAGGKAQQALERFQDNHAFDPEEMLEAEL